MMANLFSAFDPTTQMFSMNWLSSMIFILVLPPCYWMIPSRWSMLLSNISNIVHKEFKILVKTKDYSGSTILFYTLFLTIMTNNFLGLFPYIFTSSSHLCLTLTLSIPLWLAFMLFGWYQNTTYMFAHLVPQGAPSGLLPFLVIVETISNMIRPGTLAIRLTANMIAGHLLLTLLGMSGPSLTILPLNLLVLAQLLLLTLELAVSIIQAYVFAILMTLYSSEVK